MLVSPLGMLVLATELVGIESYVVSRGLSLGGTQVTGSLWQVDATVVTVGVAVLVFVLQTHAGGTPGSSLDLLVHDSGVLSYLYVGVLALLVGGADVVAQSPPFFATIGSVVVVLALFPLVARTIQVVAYENVLERTIRALRLETQHVRMKMSFEAAAAEIVSRETAASGVVLGSPSWGYIGVQLPLTGYVYDIRLDHLREVARVSDQIDPIALAVSLGDRVTPNTPIGFVPRGAGPEATRAVCRLVRVRSRP